MTIFRYGFYELKKNIVMRGVVVWMLAISILMVLVLSSTVLQHYKQYMGMNKTMRDKGLYIYNADTLSIAIEDDVNLDEYSKCLVFSNENGVKKELKSVDHIDSSYIVYAAFDDGKVIAYDSSINEFAKPELSSGRWFRKSDEASCEVDAVITENSKDIKVGDSYELEVFNDSDEIEDHDRSKITVKIIGVIKDGSKIFGVLSRDNRTYGYEDAFPAYSYRYEKEPIMILNYEQLMRNTDLKEYGGVALGGCTLISYSDEIDSDEMKYNEESLSRNNMQDEMVPFEKFRENSVRNIKSEFIGYIPMILSFASMILIFIVAVETVTTKQQMKNYSVYLLCGCSKRKNIGFHIVTGIIEVGMALFIALFLLIVIMNTKLYETINISVGSTQGICVLILILMFLFTNTLVPICMLKRESVNDVLIQNRRRG